MQLRIRRLFTLVDHKIEEEGRSDAGGPLRKVGAVAVIENPFFGRGYVDDLADAIEASAKVGEELAGIAVGAMQGLPVESYGKGGLVGLGGQQEHVNAMLTTTFAEPLRAAVGGGAAWIASFTKRAAPGTPIDVPLAHKDALYVRSHYDGMTLYLQDSPQDDEMALIVCLANRGRINARVGGLAAGAIVGKDGLR